MTCVRYACAAAVLAIQLGLAAGAWAQTADVRRLTVEEAVRLALENNLGIRAARIDPQIEDLGVAQAQAAWSPTLTSTLQNASTDSPSNSFLSGAETRISDDRLNTNVGVAQTLPWGGRYNVGWDSSRSTTTNIFSNFSPQVRSSLALTYVQPLLRGFSIDTPRQQLLLSHNTREIADVTLRQAIAVTSRTVRHAYWDLAFAIAALEVQRQSLELARESLRNTRARIEIGTTPPVDQIEAEAEVAQREEAVILGEATGRHDGGRAPRAHLRSVLARFLDVADRAGGASTLRADGASTSRPPPAQHSIAGATSSRHERTSRPPTSTCVSSATRRCPTSRPASITD